MMLIKYASRGRPNKLLSVLLNIEATIGTKDYKVLLSIDEDDRHTNNEFVLSKIHRYKNVEVCIGTSKSKIDAINRDMERAGEWDILVNMSDDMIFIESNWAEKMMELIRQQWGDSTDYFAHFSDGYVKEKLPTMSIMGREYYNRFGYIYHPSYKSFSCDAEAMFVAMMLDRYKYFPHCYFLHNHPANINLPNDETYKRNADHSNYDVNNYFERRKQLFYVDNPKVIPFNPNVRE